MTTDDDDRVGSFAPRGVYGNAPEVEHVQHVRVDELGREIERDHVEVTGRAMRVDREERNASLAHQGFEVDPRRVRTLGNGVGALIQDLVQDLQPLIGQADLVHIGIREQPGDFALTVTRLDGPVLAPDVAGWFAHPRQQRFDPRPEGSHFFDPTQGSQRILRIWTLSTRPTRIAKATKDEPPYERNGRGTPVTGMIPMVMPMFWNTCHITIPNTPAQM